MADAEDTPTTDADDSTATAEPEAVETAEAAEAAEAADKQPEKLQQTVDIRDIGPCKKHIKVTVDRDAIDARLDEKYSELVTEHRSQVQGFRPGKAPRKLVERFYREEIE